MSLAVMKDVSRSRYPSSFDNHRYPKDIKYRPNWIYLGRQARSYDDFRKTKHVEAMLKRREEVKDRPDPLFLKLMFQLRLHAIILAYFPQGSKYHRDLIDYNDHPGWNGPMTGREWHILDSLVKAVGDLERSPTSTKTFDRADRMFGVYRHDRWLASF